MTSLLRRLKACLPEHHPVRLWWHYGKAFLAAVRYGFPARKLTVIGITGTDGKTTTVAMTAHILRHAKHSVGFVSTTAFGINGETRPNVTQKTSVSPFVLQKQIKRMVKAVCAFAVLEISSHGLVQGRVHHIYPMVAAITNTSAEHLDYHGTIEQYRLDKGKLFRMLKEKGTKVLNAGDETFEMYRGIPSENMIVWKGLSGLSGLHTVAFSEQSVGEAKTGLLGLLGLSNERENVNYWISDVEATEHGSCAMLHTDFGGTMKMELNIPGLFNLENALTAIGCAAAVGIPLEQCLQALRNFRGVEGRMEEIACGQPFRVFVDFTVTPAAYERVLTAIRSMIPNGKRILVMASSCGNRMREKRPELGRICSRFADVLVVTSDETYGEPHEKIIEEIWAGIDQSRVTAFKVLDRREAIAFILHQAQKDDVVLICGMAGVTTMMTANGQIPWDERAIVRGELADFSY